MKIPMRVDYGVRALVELALHYGDGPVQTAEIAAKQGIPEAYLDQLMASLNKFGFVVSRRGPRGGHILAMPPSEINLSMVMSKLDANTSPWTAWSTLSTASYLITARSRKSGSRSKRLSWTCSATSRWPVWPIVS